MVMFTNPANRLTVDNIAAVGGTVEVRLLNSADNGRLGITALRM
jgi:hypothetical protein